MNAEVILAQLAIHNNGKIVYHGSKVYCCGSDTDVFALEPHNLQAALDSLTCPPQDTSLISKQGHACTLCRWKYSEFQLDVTFVGPRLWSAIIGAGVEDRTDGLYITHMSQAVNYAEMVNTHSSPSQYNNMVRLRGMQGLYLMATTLLTNEQEAHTLQFCLNNMDIKHASCFKKIYSDHMQTTTSLLELQQELLQRVKQVNGLKKVLSEKLAQFEEMALEKVKLEKTNVNLLAEIRALNAREKQSPQKEQQDTLSQLETQIQKFKSQENTADRKIDDLKTSLTSLQKENKKLQKQLTEEMMMSNGMIERAEELQKQLRRHQSVKRDADTQTSDVKRIDPHQLSSSTLNAMQPLVTTVFESFLKLLTGEPRMKLFSGINISDDHATINCSIQELMCVAYNNLIMPNSLAIPIYGNQEMSQLVASVFVCLDIFKTSFQILLIQQKDAKLVVYISKPLQLIHTLLDGPCPKLELFMEISQTNPTNDFNLVNKSITPVVGVKTALDWIGFKIFDRREFKDLYNKIMQEIFKDDKTQVEHWFIGL